MSEKLIELRSEEGQALLKDASIQGRGLCQPYLGKVFTKQKGNSSCGIQSCALLLASASLGSKYPLKTATDTIEEGIDLTNLPFTEAKLLENPTVVSVLSQTEYSEKGAGLMLNEVHDVLKACGHDVEFIRTSQSSPDDFRSRAVQALSEVNSSSGVIVNYHMDTLGQELPFGHHSPLGGYHKESDRFLIYDCWPATEASWAKTQHLFKAMDVVDPVGKKSRGFCIIKKFEGIKIK